MSDSFDRWLAAMDATGEIECRILAKSWREDPHLCEVVKVELGKAFDAAPGNPRSALENLPPEVWFQCVCEVSDSGAEPDQLSRLTHAEGFERSTGMSLVRTTLENLEDYSPDVWIGEIRGRAPLCFSCPSHEIEQEEGDRLRDLLGLGLMLFESRPGLEKRNWLIEIIYPVASVPPSHVGSDSKLYRPTCADAGDYPPFLPSPQGSPTGKTQDLASGNRAVTEYIHAPAPSNQAIRARHRGDLTKAPSQDWIAHRIRVT